MSAKKPLAAVVGFIGKLPYAGMSLYNLHYIAGLQALGYDVHYIERINRSLECYDPVLRSATDDPTFALRYLRELLPAYGVEAEKISLIDLQNTCHGSGWAVLRQSLSRASFLLTLADPTWFEELEVCPRRGFVDGDPMFTQVAMLDRGSATAAALSRYPVLFTYCARMASPDCMVPKADREWIPTRPVVATKLWEVSSGNGGHAVTTLMHWASGVDLIHDGKVYGHKDREFQKFLHLPANSSHRFVLAVGGRKAPREQLRACGWEVADPLEVTGTIERYRGFIAGSRADLGIAKHAYVASRSGWFSDRATCFMASGRPVLHQDTGFSDWLPVDAGVMSFSSPDEVAAALQELDGDYDRHSRAARAIAGEYFEASTVLARMLKDAGWS